MPQVTREADVAKQHRRFKSENYTIESSCDEIETNSQDSFPASDAPSWTPITRIWKSPSELVPLHGDYDFLDVSG